MHRTPIFGSLQNENTRSLVVVLIFLDGDCLRQAVEKLAQRNIIAGKFLKAVRRNTNLSSSSETLGCSSAAYSSLRRCGRKLGLDLLEDAPALALLDPGDVVLVF